MSRKNGVCSSEHEDELIFQMSPVLAQSPPRIFFDSANELRSEPLRVQQSAMQTLSVLWENHKRPSQPESLTPPTKSTKRNSPKSKTMPSRRTRTGTVTQHQRVASDSATNKSYSSRRRSSQNAKALLDLASFVQTPPSPTSLERPEPFLYSFPSFESFELKKARKERAERAARLARGERSSSAETDATSASDDKGFTEEDRSQLRSEPSQNSSLIGARKLRVNSGESLDDDFESANYISNAFRSESLYSVNRMSETDEGAEADYEDSFFSHGPSSVSSSEITTADHSVGSDISSSLLESFPLRPPSPSNSRSKSYSRHDATSKSHSRLQVTRDALDARAELGAVSEAEALRNRGRPRTTHFRRMSEQLQLQTPAADSRERSDCECARTPALSRGSESSVHSTSAAFAWFT